MTRDEAIDAAFGKYADLYRKATRRGIGGWWYREIVMRFKLLRLPPPEAPDG